MRNATLFLAAALALLAGSSMWLTATPDLLEERAEALLDQRGRAALSDATALFRRALERDPASAYRWCRLGEAVQEEGQHRTARYCFLRAAELGPSVPPVLMRAANFHFGTGGTSEGLACTRRILALVRDYDDVIFGTWSRMGVAEQEVLANGFPPPHETRAAYFRHVLDGQSVSAAKRVWAWLERSGAADTAQATSYCEFLLGHREYEAGVALWARALGPRSPGFLRLNRVFNGGWEAPPGAGALDWRIIPVEGVTAERDPHVAHSGANSLRLDFDGGTNLAYRGTRQSVVAPPGVYRFRAFARTERVTSDQGIRFRIFDHEASAYVDAATEQVTGTRGWTELTARVVVPAATRLLALEIEREPSRKFDNRLSGTVWIDDVELVPVR